MNETVSVYFYPLRAEPLPDIRLFQATLNEDAVQGEQEAVEETIEKT